VPDLIGARRILLPPAVGTVPHLELLRAVELRGTVAAPAVRTGTS
jgi:hypothetical protein